MNVLKSSVHALSRWPATEDRGPAERAFMIRLGLLAILIASFPLGLAAQDPYVWYDGTDARTVYLQVGLVASFDGEKSSEAIQRTGGGATLLHKSGAVRVMRIAPGSDLARALRRGEKHGVGRISPVFSTSADGGSRQALPGNIIVSLDRNYSHAQVEAWAASRRLRLLRRLPLVGNYYEIASEPGLPSLLLANSLRQHPGVESCVPNWWREVQAR